MKHLRNATVPFVVLLFGCVPLSSVRTIASELSGVVVDRTGAPQPGIRLHRHVFYHWTQYTQDDDAATDAQGRFRLPSIHKASAVSIAHQPVINEELSVEIDGSRVVLWTVAKMDYDTNGENRGKPFALRCVLDGPKSLCAMSSPLAANTP
jgi:hypothetical protein